MDKKDKDFEDEYVVIAIDITNINFTNRCHYFIYLIYDRLCIQKIIL